MATGAKAVGSNQVNSNVCAVALSNTIVAGDILYAILGHGTAGVTVTVVPTGWSVLSPVTSTQSLAGAVYTKVADATDAGKTISWTVSASGKHGWNIFAASGASDAGIVSVSSFTTAGQNRLAPALACRDRSFEIGITKGTAPLSWTAYPSSFALVQSVVQTGSGALLIDVATSTADLDGNDTWSGSASQNQAIMYTISPTPSAPVGPVPGTQVYKWPTSRAADRVRVKSKVASATSVRLKCSVNSDMSAPFYVSAQVPDSDGYITHIANGLLPETRYYYQLADTPAGGSETVIGTKGSITTLQTVGKPFGTPLKISMGGCNKTADATSVAYANSIAWGFSIGYHNGDLTYHGTESTDEAAHRAMIDDQLAAVPNLREYLAQGGAAIYGRSDHDCGIQDNGDSNNAWTAANQRAYLKYFPWESLNDPQSPITALDQIINTGRVSFFLIDNRSPDRSPGTQADTSAKTLLGVLQKARLKIWLLTNPAPFKVILGDTAWMGAPDMVNKIDWWPAYSTERDEVSAVINQVQKQGVHVEFWHGDSHLIGYATAAKNTWGNFPVLCAAGFAQDGGGRNTSTFSSYFNNASGTVSEYGRITIADNGKTMTRTFSGWDAVADVERVRDVVTFDVPNLSAPLLSLMM